MFSTMDLHLFTNVLILFLLTIIDFLNHLLQKNENYYYTLLFSIVSLVSAACYINKMHFLITGFLSVDEGARSSARKYPRKRRRDIGTKSRKE